MSCLDLLERACEGAAPKRGVVGQGDGESRLVVEFGLKASGAERRRLASLHHA